MNPTDRKSIYTRDVDALHRHIEAQREVIERLLADVQRLMPRGLSSVAATVKTADELVTAVLSQIDSRGADA